MSFRIVHISSVHPWKDPRIFLKQCVSLSEQGFDVHLLTPDSNDEKQEGVHLHRVWSQDPENMKKGLIRKLFRPYTLFKKARALDPDIIHFHDPELIPWALAHRMVGYELVYDVHEDNKTAIRHRSYIKKPFKAVLSWAIGLIESLAHATMPTVLAEAYYQRRFPKGTIVANYQHIPEHWLPEKKIGPPTDEQGRSHILYTGNIEIERGVIKYLEATRSLDQVHLHLIGRCYTHTFEKTKEAQEGLDGRVHWEEVGTYVPFQRIIERYAERDWLAGLIVFPYSDHYKDKYPTKFFEYMAFGIPIIYSDFPEWKKLLEPLEVGLAVNPNHPQELVEALLRLENEPQLWQRLSNNAITHSKKFSWNHEAKKLTSLYNQLLEHHD